jgi:TfoX/Sxy family transcriptional regulator of competence genes
MAAADLQPLREALEAAAHPLDPPPDLSFRAMFGGLMVYAAGRPLAILADVGLGQQIAPAEQGDLLAEEGARHLQYESGAPISKQYVIVPPAFVTVPERLRPWLTRSLAYVQTLPPPKKRSRKRPSG